MTDYMTRLMRYVEFYESRSCPCTTTSSTSSTKPARLRQVGLRRTLLGCWDRSRSRGLQLCYKDMERWGDAMFVTPA